MSEPPGTCGMRGGGKKYTGSWKEGLPKKPGYSLVREKGVIFYRRKDARAKTAWNVFVEEHRKMFGKASSLAEVLKSAGKEWKSLSASQKSVYEAKAKKAGKTTAKGPATKELPKVYQKMVNKD